MATAFVTGTSTGIGFATALRLAEAGYDVLAGMRSPETAGAALVDAGAAHPGTITPIRVDVDDDASVQAAFRQGGPVEVLVNNAGASPVGAVEEFPVEELKALFETNVFGAVRCMQAALPAMRAAGRGVVVNISSVAGRAAQPMFGPYSASKSALEALSESLAAEARPFGIRVAVVEPGAIATPIRAKTIPPGRDTPYREAAKNWGFASRWVHARASAPELVADAVLTAVEDPDARFRYPVGQGCVETIQLRAEMRDEDWIALWGAPTAEFLERYRELTGTDLTS